MAPTHDLLALFGALDRSVVVADDPKWTQLVESYLPGTTGPGRQGWYEQVVNLMRLLAPNPDAVPTPSLDTAVQNLSALVHRISPAEPPASDSAAETIPPDEDADWTLGNAGAPNLTATQKSQLFYAAAMLAVLAPQAPPEAELDRLATNLGVLDDFYGLAGDPLPIDEAGSADDLTSTRSNRIGVIKSWLTPARFAGIEEWPRLVTGVLQEDATAIRPEVANVALVFGTGSMTMRSGTGGMSADTGAVGAVTEIDGTLCAVLTTDASRPDVTIKQIKDIVDPLNWDQLSRFFVKMPKMPCTAEGSSRVLEHVSTQPDAYQLKTALKYWKANFGKADAAAGQPDPAGIVNYELSDNRIGTGDNGLVLVDNGYIRVGPNVRDGVQSPGVRITTSKMVAIQGCSVTATAMFINMLGWSSLGNSMLFDSVKRPPSSYTRPLQPWQPSPEAATATGIAAGQGKPATTAPTPPPAGTYSSIFGELAKAWAQSVTQAATSATTLATKWSKNGLTVQDLIDESTKLGGQFASQPWRYLAAAQQPVPAPPGTGTTTTGGAT
ncbi:Uncharacterised protein [Mycobacteroides abscessus subsp. abscessus]|nr:Uncharacterised protein [Mycobacteroides abscessus subsp. abscessus]